MATWKELGEVPDSDDDDGGLDDLAFDYEANKPNPADKPKSPAAPDDIWAIPDSPPNDKPSDKTSALASRADLPASSPLGSRATQQDEIGSSPLSPAPDSSVDSEDNPSNADNAFDRRQSFAEEDDVSQGYVRTSAPLPVFDGSDSDEEEQLLGLSKSHDGENQEQRSNRIALEDDPRSARQAAVRYERSLRPRKPIQEHPYLLENARYATALKEHGLKPVRVTVDPEPARKVYEEEDSQEQDYEDDTQAIAQMESQMIAGSGEAPNDLDPFHIPSSPLLVTSSPARTSPRHRAGLSSGFSSANKTDNTSLIGDDDEELPSLADILKRTPGTAASSSKRRIRHDKSPSRKRLKQRTNPAANSTTKAVFRVPEAYNMPDSSPVPGPVPRFSRIDPRDAGVDIQEDGSESETPIFEDTSGKSPETTSQNSVVVEINRRRDVTYGSVLDESTESSSSSEAEEIVRTVGKRIRGVLPASWLRLDQQPARDSLRQNLQKRNHDIQTEQFPRRGVAQPKQVQTTSPAPMVVFEDSESEDELPALVSETEKNYTQARILLQPLSDDDEVIMEDDHIDLMRPREKPKTPFLGVKSMGSNHRRVQQKSSHRGRKVRGSRQPKITAMLNGSSTTTEGLRQGLSKPRRRTTGTRRDPGRPSKQVSKPPKPPQLSILDVLVPDAPQFIKIAARSARRLPNLGRTSPGRKTISLATRHDNLDALQVLQDWKRGKIKPITLSPRPSPPEPALRKALRTISPNVLPRSKPNAPFGRQSSAAPRRITKQTSQNGSIRYETRIDSPKDRMDEENVERRVNQEASRPAQLETEQYEQPRRLAFNAHKRTLDALFRHAKKTMTASDNGSLFGGVDTDLIPAPAEIVEPEQSPHIGVRGHLTWKSRYRKRARPQQIDLDAPQYAHAQDDLPGEVFIESAPPVADSQNLKLEGIGPFGTTYTRHFEVFPLDRGVFFHESTLIGSGSLEPLDGSLFIDKLRHTRPRTSFTLDDQVLRWGPWGDELSSELGILIDWISDKIQTREGETNEAEERKAARGARFILDSIQSSLSLPDDAACRAFISRIVELLSGFQTRLENAHTSNNLMRTDEREKPLVEIIVCSITVLFYALRLCHSSAPLGDQIFTLEMLLQKLAKTGIRHLLDRGVESLQNLYGSLQQPEVRERGIREDEYVPHAWVVVMRILEIANIPRGSFWDVTYSVLLQKSLGSTVDARHFEQLWRVMFNLLPLCEFDNSGVIVSGMRHSVSMDGWRLPQDILKRVFELYKTNPRQASGFNDYCRALVSRCHYLVQHWGWRKCSSVVGLIFDFFGSQNLSHLRNEEVYKSPHFLELLMQNPSLSVEPEDRCFHIFLKLLAVAIKRLGEVGMTNDIRNLVTRTMPNHNRQYLKEHSVDQHDLAALRNHHDLLCTLFWAAPAEYRPAVHTIEKLVVPASSHKEACLINLRTWSQLTRFVASSTEDSAMLLPLLFWQNRVVQPLTEQFDGADAELQQEFLKLSKDESQLISNALLRVMATTNRAAVLDVLYFSVKATFDVLKLAQSIETATLIINPVQISLVLKHFVMDPPDMDWAILHATLKTLDHYLDRLDREQAEASQNDSCQTTSVSALDDAIMMLENCVAGDFFSVTRCLTSNAEQSQNGVSINEQSTCIELATVVCAKLTATFMRSGIVSLSQLFAHGRYGLFDASILELSLGQRKYFSLFCAVLLEQQVTDLTDTGTTLLEVWLLSIVKPHRYLLFETRLGEQLKLFGCEFVPEAIIGLALCPDYALCRDYFECALSWMRKSLLEDNVSLRKQLSNEFSKALQKVMQQIKADLRTVSTASAEHDAFMNFVRDVISIIRSHGSEICAVDEFFYQISKEYSPPLQDPRLHVAGIISYGIRLAEGDSKVAPQLFYYLYNNFKVALANDKLKEEALMIQKGMENPGFLSFVLGTMLPAIIRAVGTVVNGYPILDVYSCAIRRFLTNGVAPQQISERDLPNIVTLTRAIRNGLWQLRASVPVGMTLEQLHLEQQMLRVMGMLQSTSEVMAVNFGQSGSVQTLMDELALFSRFAIAAEEHLADVFADETSDLGISNMHLLRASEPLQPGDAQESQIASFASNIVKDVESNWVITSELISIQAPARGRTMPSTTQGAQGSKRPSWEFPELVTDLHAQLRSWNHWWAERWNLPGTRRLAEVGGFDMAPF